MHTGKQPYGMYRLVGVYVGGFSKARNLLICQWCSRANSSFVINLQQQGRWASSAQLEAVLADECD